MGVDYISTKNERKEFLQGALIGRQFEDRFKPGFIEYLDSVGYFTAPSSRSFHGVWEGGNFDHSNAVRKNLRELNHKFNLGLDAFSVFVIGMFHDLCKSDLYVWNKEQQKYVYNPFVTTEHATKSLKMLEPWVDLTEEERLCIRFHMGPYEIDDWKEMDEAIAKYPSVYWTHVADMMAAKLQEL